jgi:predicted 2-oxoglutarate/Fe(II)-dependent dioxygenase YbiX
MSKRPLYWYWHNSLNIKEIKKINKFIIKNNDGDEDKESAATGNNDERLKFLKTKIIKFGKIKKLINKIVENVYLANRNEFGFTLYDLKDSDGANYNIYDANTKDNYQWHIDRSLNNCTDIKLTVIINLSEKPFEGGDLFLQQTGTTPVPEIKNIGGVVMFPSFIRHMVTPVTEGVRKNLVLFLNGPNLK